MHQDLLVVVIASGAGSSPPPSDEERAALVVAADGGLEAAAALGLRAGVVVGDLDSAPPALVAAAAAQGAEVVRHPVAKDATDLELGLDEAVARGATRILVRSSAGGRLDHALGGLLLLAAAKYAAVTVDALCDGALVHVVRGRRRLHGTPGELLTLIPAGGAAEGCRTSGLEYPLRGETLHAGSSRGLSNVFAAETVDLEVERGALLAVRPFPFTPQEAS